MMGVGALAFNVTKFNKNSIAVLTGALEMDPRLTGLDIYFLERKKGLSEQIRGLSWKYEKVIVGFSFHTPDIVNVAETVANVQATLRAEGISNITFVAGGPHPSGDPIGTLRMGFDFVVVGEGEETFPTLLDRINAEEDPTNVKGVYYCKGTERVFIGRAEIVNLNKFPPFAEKHRRFAPIEISRGCPWGCKFCQVTFLWGRIRHRRVDNIVRYAQTSLKRGFKDIRFVSSNALAYGSPDGRKPCLAELECLLKALSKTVGKQHVLFGTFPSEVRPEFITKETIELILTYTNNETIAFGAQSGSQRVLDLMNRGHTVDDIHRAAELISKAGLVAKVDFMFGYPGETKPDRELTMKIIQDLDSRGAVTRSHTFIPLVGTPIANAPPGVLNKRIRSFLGRRVKRGQECGPWQRKEEIARKVAEFRDQNRFTENA